MDLLDKIIETKDLKIYLDLRCRRLREHARNIKTEKPANRQKLIDKYHVRIKELERLKKLINNKTLKRDCKQMWKHFNE